MNKQDEKLKNNNQAPKAASLFFSAFFFFDYSHERYLTNAVRRPRTTLPEVPHREQHQDLVERRDPEVGVVGALERGPQVIVIGKVLAAVKPQASMPHQFVFPHDEDMVLIAYALILFGKLWKRKKAPSLSPSLSSL